MHVGLDGLYLSDHGRSASAKLLVACQATCSLKQDSGRETTATTLKFLGLEEAGCIARKPTLVAAHEALK